LYDLSGSMGKGKTGPQLTPFEQAEYNIAMFATRAILTEELDELVRQSAALEKLKEIAMSAEPGILTSQRVAIIERELKTIDDMIQRICESFEACGDN